MFRMTAPTRIAFGLASLCLGLLCAANSMGLMPDLRAVQAERRQIVVRGRGLASLSGGAA